MSKERSFHGNWYAHPVMRNALVAAVLTAVAFGAGHLGLILRSVEIALYLVAIVLGGWHWAWEGIEDLVREKRVGIEILMLFATVGSAVLGMWDEAAALVVLYGVAEALEEYAFDRTRASISKLLDLAPREARLLVDGEENMVPAAKLQKDDFFLVKPGESLATDGIVEKGRSSVNEAAVTGESVPVEKKEGMKVFAGTLNQSGALTIRATATSEDNTLARMIHLVEEAQEQKGKAQLFIDRFGRIYTPAVLVAAGLLLVVAMLYGASASSWGTRAVVLLVAAAPCALVMSTPVTIAAGIGRAGRSGVLIKGGIHLENLGKVRAVAFDKTGTLTRGEPVVTDVIPIEGDASEILRLAYAVEQFSEHPLAQAVVRKAREERRHRAEAEDFKALEGYGATANVAGEKVFVGKPGLLRKLDLAPSELPEIERLQQEGKTIILVGVGESVQGVIGIRDEVRPEARDVVDRLHQLGIKTVMLTGDHKGTARSIAEELDLDDVRADLTPEDKLQAVTDLEREFGTLVMVGDGINDAPALARATVGIAMGTAGTDAAIEAADVALMADDLEKLVYALDLGQRVRRINAQNIVFSLLVLAVLVPSALLGVMGVALAVFFHEGSELLAVANGLRAARS